MHEANILMMGATAMAALACALIFLRYYRDGHDTLFLFFALSFFVQAMNRVALALSPKPNEGGAAHYCVRLLAYGLILAGVVLKNRPRR